MRGRNTARAQERSRARTYVPEARGVGGRCEGLFGNVAAELQRTRANSAVEGAALELGRQVAAAQSITATQLQQLWHNSRHRTHASAALNALELVR